MQYKIYSALFKPIFFLGVPGIQIFLELFIAMFLGMFISWYFIVLVVVLHIVSSCIYRKDQFLLDVIIWSVVRMNIESDFVKGEKNEI